MLTAKIRQKLEAKRAPTPQKKKSMVVSPARPVVLSKTRPVKAELHKVAPKKAAPKQQPKPELEPKMVTTPAPQSTPVTLPPPAPAALETVPMPVKVILKPIPELVVPKVDTEPVVLGAYFAVQILRGESVGAVANAVLTAADASGILFRKLQVMDIMAVGATPFVRFRSDITGLDKVLGSLPARSLISSDSSGAYIVSFQDGRRGKYPTATMNSSPKLGFGQTFAGTRIARWSQQFATA